MSVDVQKLAGDMQKLTVQEQGPKVDSQKLAKFLREGAEGRAGLPSFERFMTTFCGKFSSFLRAASGDDNYENWVSPTKEEYKAWVSAAGMDVPELASRLNEASIDLDDVADPSSAEAQKLFGEAAVPPEKLGAIRNLCLSLFAYFDYCNLFCDAAGCDYPPGVGFPGKPWGYRARRPRSKKEAVMYLAIAAYAHEDPEACRGVLVGTEYDLGEWANQTKRRRVGA